MEAPFRVGTGQRGTLHVLCEDEQRVLCRECLIADGGQASSVLVVAPATESASPLLIEQFTREYGLKDELESGWAVRPIKLQSESGRPVLVLEDPGGDPLQRLLGAPMELGKFLRLAIGIAKALGCAHQRRLVHKDLRPSNILVDEVKADAKLTGFGMASRLARERQAPGPPETIVGSLPYMAPEQTGRMNRSIDSRSDLYSLGITLYRMLTGQLPFVASAPMEWVHCHIARWPVAPAERRKDVPNEVSAIVMKLLAKLAEERYQSAAGLESDLRRCLEAWQFTNQIDDFELGQHDVLDRLFVPEKLYGREQEIDKLLSTFRRIAESGAPELVLVSGYSGIGKSSVVNELHRVLVPPHGLFATGKFDQYKRDIPYATLAQALQSLTRALLGKTDAELSSWRSSILEAVGANGRLMVDLVPELSVIIGEQPPPPYLPSQDAQRRFQFVFRRFIGVFATRAHPLALFLDDLQWLDSATLDLLEDVLTKSDLTYFMLIGAYRDNEVGPTHPLTQMPERIRTVGGRITEINLGSLTPEDMQNLIADTFRCGAEQAAPLAQLVHKKTGGNPYFSIQFISSLYDEGLINFDHEIAGWSWDLGQINAKGRYTDNIVDLMVSKIARLPAETQTALQQLSLLGSVARIDTAAISLNTSREELHRALLPALQHDLTECVDGTYRFAHDRVREGAYSLIPEDTRAARHLEIGRLIASQSDAGKLQEKVFEIVNQLNRGIDLIETLDERERLAELNFIAGRRAKRATAYAAALQFFCLGRTLLTQDCWERRYKLTFAFELNRAECEFLAGDQESAGQHLALLAARAVGAADQAAVACQRIDLLMTLGRTLKCVEIGLDYLRTNGTDWSPHPAREEMTKEFERIWQRLGSRSIDSLIDLPLMKDSAGQAQMSVLTALLPPALFSDQNLFGLIVARMANISIEHGNTDGSCLAYVWLGLMLGPHFDNYPAAFQFGQLGFDLVEKRDLKRFRARVYLDYSHVVNPWRQHVRSGPELVRRALAAANDTGDLTFAAYSSCNLVSVLLAAGTPLLELQNEAERRLDFARSLHFGLITDIIAGQLQLVKALRGLTSSLASFDGPDFAETEFERRLDEDPGLTVAIGWYWVRKLQGLVFAADVKGALAAADKVEPFVWTITSHLELADFHFYAALARAASLTSAAPNDQPGLLDTLRRHRAQLATWCRYCPENFASRTALVDAEIARLEGRDFEAQRHYENATRCARRSELPHDEALAGELAGRFYLAHGFEKIAHGYLRDARNCYARWGATAKVSQLDKTYPQIHHPESWIGQVITIGAPIEHLDLATVIQVSEAVSGEVNLDRLIETIMRTAMTQAGAERALLILRRENEHRVVSEARSSGERLIVDPRNDSPTSAFLPQTVLQYVLRTQETFILNDAAAEHWSDPYIAQHRLRSLLCLPLLNRANLIGMLYLENSLTPGVFSAARLPVLKLLASQAAISLENTSLYQDLAKREARIRRLVDANILGIFFFATEGHVTEANDAFLRMIGYDREDVVGGRLRWADLTPPEWRDRDERKWLPEYRRTGILPPFEKEYFRKDGSRVPVLIGVASLEDTEDLGVAFVLDLTDRKRAEDALRDAQRQLAHANRVATMGQLTASVTHEIGQPIATARMNAAVGLRLLKQTPPDLDEVRDAFNCIVNDTNRARDIIDGLRNQFKKAPPQRDVFEVAAAIDEVLAMARAQLNSAGVSVTKSIATDMPLVRADRVQMQQVVLNLILNAVDAMNSVADGPRELLISSTFEKKDGIALAVHDSGPGLDREDAERIFEPFYTTKSSGVGMGLAICRSIIHMHGGRIWAEANKPRGAIFRFTLPSLI